RGGELETVERSGQHRVDERAAAGDRLDEADVLARDPAAGHQLVACEADHVLAGRQVAQGPVALAKAGQPDAPVAAPAVHRLEEVARQLLGAADDRDGHDVPAPRVEALLDEVEPGLPFLVDRVAVQEAHELVEAGSEWDARIVDEAPR